MALHSALAAGAKAESAMTMQMIHVFRHWRSGSVGLLAALLAALWLAASMAPAAACATAVPRGATAQIPASALDSTLIDAALLAEVNRARCAAGLRTLSPSPGLRPVAAAHAGWMAQAGVLSHSPALTGGLRSLGARLAAGGHAKRAGAENIAMVHRVPLEGQRITVRNARACQFADRQGRAIAPHSYQSLAAHLVAQWMASAGHRRNLLNPGLTAVAHAAALAPDAATCGRVYAVQVFVG
jgi:uncharacterized protein YkwD